MGCIAASAKNQSCDAGAIGAAVGEMVGDYLVEQGNESNLSAEDKQDILNRAKLVAGTVALAVGADVDTAANSAGVAVENNALAETELKAFVSEIKKCSTDQCKKGIVDKYIKKSQEKDDLLLKECGNNAASRACAGLIRVSLNYNGDNNPLKSWLNQSSNNQLIFNKLNSDMSRSRKILLEQIFTNYQIFKNINTIEARADFFDLMARQYPDTKWFAGASYVSRRKITGLGASGHGSDFTFMGGDVVSWRTDAIAWRHEAGEVLMTNGYQDFKNLWSGKVSNFRQWDINRLVAEQTILQPVHEKHIKDSFIFTTIPKYYTGSGTVNMMDLNDRIRYGCVMMGYNYNNGTCK